MRVILVGSGSTLGRRITDVFVARGDQVVGIDIQVVDHPGLTSSLVADLTDTAASEAAFAAAVDALGGLDSLVTGAAFQPRAKLHETSDAMWDAVIAGTATTTFRSMRCALPYLRGGGSIVAIGSVNAYLAHPSTAAYAAAKGAIAALVTQAAFEYGPRGIRVNLVAPGLIDGAADRAGGYPLGRTVTSEEVANAVAFLASADSSGITGAVLPVDAGLSIGSPAAFVRPDLLADWLGEVGMP